MTSCLHIAWCDRVSLLVGPIEGSIPLAVTVPGVWPGDLSYTQYNLVQRDLIAARRARATACVTYRGTAAVPKRKASSAKTDSREKCERLLVLKLELRLAERRDPGVVLAVRPHGGFRLRSHISGARERPVSLSKHVPVLADDYALELESCGERQRWQTRSGSITGASRGFGRVWAEAALVRCDRVAATARDRQPEQGTDDPFHRVDRKR